MIDRKEQRFYNNEAEDTGWDTKLSPFFADPGRLTLASLYAGMCFTLVFHLSIEGSKSKM